MRRLLKYQSEANAGKTMSGTRHIRPSLDNAIAKKANRQPPNHQGQYPGGIPPPLSGFLQWTVGGIKGLGAGWGNLVPSQKIASYVVQ